MPATGPQNDWVQRVLGVPAGASSSAQTSARSTTQAPAAPFGPLTRDLDAARKGLATSRDTMTAALSKADLQIRKLQAVLAVHPDPDLKDIAKSPEFGINAFTGNYRVKVLAALRDLEAAPAEKLPAILQKARDLVAGFDNHIRTSDRLAACDENPLGVAVSVRPLLAPALAELARSIGKFAA